MTLRKSKEQAMREALATSAERIFVRYKFKQCRECLFEHNENPDGSVHISVFCKRCGRPREKALQMFAVSMQELP